MVGPRYSTIPEKLVTKIRMGQFIDLADLLARNLKAQETEPQTYLDGKHLVTSSKKQIQEITDIVTWVEAFTVYPWILCSADPSRWQDMTQYKLLILNTSHQFPGKAWLHYDIAFSKYAAASGLVDWSPMNLDLISILVQHCYKQVHPLMSHLNPQRCWPALPMFVDPGTMAPAVGPLVSATTAIAAKNVKVSTPCQLSLSGLTAR